MNDELKFVKVIAAIFVLTMGLLLSAARLGDMWSGNAPILVTVEGKEVYRGPRYGVEIDSSGAATKVEIYGPGFFSNIKLKEAYVSNAVKVEPIRKVAE